MYNYAPGQCPVILRTYFGRITHFPVPPGIVTILLIIKYTPGQYPVIFRYAISCSVILSERSESKDLRIIITTQHPGSTKILRLRASHFARNDTPNQQGRQRGN